MKRLLISTSLIMLLGLPSCRGSQSHLSSYKQNTSSIFPSDSESDALYAANAPTAWTRDERVLQELHARFPDLVVLLGQQPVRAAVDYTQHVTTLVIEYTYSGIVNDLLAAYDQAMQAHGWISMGIVQTFTTVAWYRKPQAWCHIAIDSGIQRPKRHGLHTMLISYVQTALDD